VFFFGARKRAGAVTVEGSEDWSVAHTDSSLQDECADLGALER